MQCDSDLRFFFPRERAGHPAKGALADRKEKKTLITVKPKFVPTAEAEKGQKGRPALRFEREVGHGIGNHNCCAFLPAGQRGLFLNCF